MEFDIFWQKCYR